MIDLKTLIICLWGVTAISFGLLSCYHYKLSKEQLPKEIIINTEEIDKERSGETKSFIKQFNELNKQSNLVQMYANIISGIVSIASLLITLYYM